MIPRDLGKVDLSIFEALQAAREKQSFPDPHVELRQMRKDCNYRDSIHHPGMTWEDLSYDHLRDRTQQKKEEAEKLKRKVKAKEFKEQ